MKDRPGNLTDVEFERLLYRRQFVLGPRAAPRGNEWHLHSVPGGLTLAAHPDLAVVQFVRKGLHLTLIGYMLDPSHPERSDGEILAALADCSRLADLPQRTSELGGRWVLFAHDGQKGILFSDACGFRQVHYADSSHSEFWCGTQPQGIAIDGLEVSTEGREFLSSDYVAKTPEYEWPIGTSPFAGIRRLLPNHYLEMPGKAVCRFWPENPISNVDFREAVVRCAGILKGLMAAAALRFPLAMPLTAGFDSRLLLSAARDVAPSLFSYTLRFPGYSRRHRDIVIARRVLRRLGLEHHVLTCPPTASGRFAEAYSRSIAPDRPTADAIAQGIFMHYPPGHVCVVGHGGEIGRCYYYWREDQYPSELSASSLAKTVKMTGNGLAIRAFGVWLEDARRIERDYGVRVLDLLYWEQRVGCWAAAGQAEWDLVHDRFPPYSCRELLSTMLGVDVTLRQDPGYELQIEVMRALWPQVLSVPFNPAPRTFRNRLRSTPLYPLRNLIKKFIRLYCGP